MASFEFYNDYEKTAYALQPELYGEIASVLNSEFRQFSEASGRLPRVLDVGAAGIIPYDPALTEATTILDLFEKPAALELKEGVGWRVGNILDVDPAEDGAWDVIVFSSVLHHLADKHNNAFANVCRAATCSARRLRPGGRVVVVESCCSRAVASLQDVLYPLYSRFLVHAVRFTYVRMLSLEEVTKAFAAADLATEEVAFTQPEYIAQVRWRIRSKYYPLTVRCLRAIKGDG
jgi:SAM-dependent methyltransferase